jgi:HD-GYP domain-containing protein (c-di-GMP phosphodiesterase class II)
METSSSPVRFFSLSEVISSLSFALDLTEGQPPGHTMRSCAIGMRLGSEIGLSAAELSSLFYALLLKDAGCSTNAAALAEGFAADDQQVKRAHKFADLGNPFSGARYVWRSVAPKGPWLDRVRLFVQIARGQRFETRELIRIRCERGADIAARLGFPVQTTEAVRALDEHWDGSGHPDGLEGEAIPLLGRIACIAQTAEVYATARGSDHACDVVLLRSGSWFDPRLSTVIAGWRADREWWRKLQSAELPAMLAGAEPRDLIRTVNDDGLDQIAEAFAEIIDTKSPYTYRHSSNVAHFARGIASRLQLDKSEQRRIYRAGLLHDVGKLGVSNLILDKPGQLTSDEWQAMRQHPRYTLDILERIRAFEEFARTAALHHERLDGQGYPWRLPGSELDIAARLLAVADVYEALTADRPYRRGLDRSEAFVILERGIGTIFDGDAVAALAAWLDRSAGEL